MITSCLERKGGLMCFSRNFLTHTRTKPNCNSSWLAKFSDSIPEDRQIQEKEQCQTAEDAPDSVQPPPACKP